MSDRHSNDEISAGLARLAAEYASASPPVNLESRLLAEIKGTNAGSRKRFPFWLLAMTAPILSVVIMLYRSGSHSQAVGEPFYQMPYVAPAAPYERTEVRRENVPVAALISAGLDVHVPDSGAVVTADVLFGQDGRALAISLIPDPSPVNTRRGVR
jgi:hypothetical protein